MIKGSHRKGMQKESRSTSRQRPQEKSANPNKPSARCMGGEGESDDEGEQVNWYPLFAMGHTAPEPAIHVPLKVNGKDIHFELHTGASLSVMSFDKFRASIIC